MIPLVTVIVTVYKRTQFLEEALHSVLRQTFRLYEVIVTDDSCSDSIKSICNSFQNSKISYRANYPTLGAALNLRAAINEAQGKYIAILNDDDVWEPEFLEKLVAPLEQNTNRVLAFSDHWIMLENGKIDVKKTNENSIHYGRSSLPKGDVDDLATFVLEKNGVPLAMASLFRKSAINIDLLFEEVSGAYDFWISCLLAASKRSAYYVPERLTRYRIHSEMETARKSPDKNENMVFIYNKIIDLGFFSNKKTLLLNRYSQALYWVGRDNLYFSHLQKARLYFWKSLKESLNYKSIISLLISFLPKKCRIALRFSL